MRKYQHHAKATNRAQRRAQIDNVANHEQQPQQYSQRQFLDIIYAAPLDIVVLSWIEGQRQQQEGEDPPYQ